MHGDMSLSLGIIFMEDIFLLQYRIVLCVCWRDPVTIGFSFRGVHMQKLRSLLSGSMSHWPGIMMGLVVGGILKNA